MIFLGSAHLWIAGAVAATLVSVCTVQTLRLARTQTALAHEQRDRAADVAHLQQAARAQSERFRLTELAWGATQHANATMAHKARELAAVDAASAASSADRLRQRIATLAATCGAPARHSTVISPGAPASAPADLFADLFGRMDADARRIAEYADAAGIAGEHCAADYSALTGSPAP